MINDLTTKYDNSILKKFPLDSLSFFVTPFYNFKKNNLSSTNYKFAFENYIDFDLQNENLRVVLTIDDTIVGEFLSADFTDTASGSNLLNAISFSDYADPRRAGGYNNKLRLDKDHFTFIIRDIWAFCIIEKGKIYVIDKADNNGKFQKIPLNHYIDQTFTKNDLSKLLNLDKKTIRKRKKRCEKSKESLNTYIKVVNIDLVKWE